MNAIEVKSIIDSKRNDIAETIAFFCGNEYREYILDKIEGLNFYVFESDLQQERLENVELLSIANSFAKELIEDLDLSKQREKELSLLVSKIIHDAYYIVDDQIDEYIDYNIDRINEFREHKDEKGNELYKLINYYINDYEVKDIYERINSINNQTTTFNAKIVNCKRNLLEEFFKIKIDDYSVVNFIWKLLSSFHPEYDKLMDNQILDKMIEKNRYDFYNYINCKGDTLEEIVKDAKRRKVYISESKYMEIQSRYLNEYNKIAKLYIDLNSNMNYILDDLNDKGYKFPKEFIIESMFNSSNIYGITIECLNSSGEDDSFIIYNNNIYLYSKDFNETCIHEMLHYLGGANSKINKRGLHYNNELKYLHLEEAFVNYLSMNISEEYFNRYSNIINPVVEKERSSKYDRSLAYIAEVFKKYSKELIRIHLSDNLSLTDAKKICPIESIANSITRIMEAEINEVKSIVDIEIKNINKENKR